MDSKFSVAIICISDRASTGEYEDKSGACIDEFLKQHIDQPWERIYKIVADDETALTGLLLDLIHDKKIPLIISTGGTGLGPRDFTPEIIESLKAKIIPGFGEKMRLDGGKHTDFAWLSRQGAALLEQSVILYLPGSPKAVQECLDSVFFLLPHALKTAGAASFKLKKGSPGSI